MNIQALAKQAVALTRKHSPLIATVVAVGGVVATAVAAAKAAPKAEEALDDLREVTLDENARPVKPSLPQKAKATWKIWLPTVVSGGLTIGSIILAHSLHTKRYAALMGLYVAGNQAFQELKEAIEESSATNKVKEEIKEKASEKAAARIDAKQPEGFQAASAFGGGTLFYDALIGRPFYSDIDTIDRAVNRFNQGLLHHDYSCLNEFYAILGLDPVDIGSEVGWNNSNLMEIEKNAFLVSESEPAIMITHASKPSFDYYRRSLHG